MVTNTQNQTNIFEPIQVQVGVQISKIWSLSSKLLYCIAVVVFTVNIYSCFRKLYYIEKTHITHKFKILLPKLRVIKIIKQQLLFPSQLSLTWEFVVFNFQLKIFENTNY